MTHPPQSADDRLPTVAWANVAPEEGEVYSVSLKPAPYHDTALVLRSDALVLLSELAAAKEPAALRWRRVAGRGPWEYVTLEPGAETSWIGPQVRDGGEVEWLSVGGKVEKP